MSVSFEDKDESGRESIDILSPTAIIMAGNDSISLKTNEKESEVSDNELEDDFNDNLGTIGRSSGTGIELGSENGRKGPETSTSVGIPVKRPQAIGDLLDRVSERFESGEEMYCTFIEMASESLREENNSGLYSIKTELKFNDKICNSEIESMDANMNSSLVRIFMFYAAIQNPTSATTFSATAVENETMSFYELDKMARDFKIVPKFLTKSELKLIWDDFVYIHAVRSGGKPIAALIFEDFQDIFVRMALYSYNKPGMKKMILAVTGFFPPPSELVLCLCHQLGLDNFQGVKEHLMVKGRETQGAINYRSASEINWRAREEHLIDLRAKQLERVTAHERTQKEKASKAKLKRIRAQRGDEASLASVGKVKGPDKPKSVQYGLWSSLGGQAYALSSKAARERKVVTTQKTSIPDEILSMLDGKDEDENGEVEEAENSLMSNSRGGSKGSRVIDNESGTVDDGNAESHHSSDDDDDDDDDDEGGNLENYDKAVVRAKRKGTRLAPLNQYRRDLVYALKDFSLREPERAEPNIIDSGAGFMDCGSLRPQTECRITLNVTNLMLDIATLDVQAVGFPDENCDIVTYAKPLVSGMTRKISVKFNVGLKEGCTLAQVQVTLLTQRTKLEAIVPVFLRVDHSTAPRIVANIKTLSSLEHKYHGIYKPATMAFERKKDRDSQAWIRPQEIEQARRSVHERPASQDQRRTLLRRIKSKEKHEVRQKESNVKKQTQTGSRALLEAALSDYLPQISPPSVSNMNSANGRDVQPTQLGMSRSRKTAFFAEGMTVQLAPPKQTSLQSFGSLGA